MKIYKIHLIVMLILLIGCILFLPGVEAMAQEQNTNVVIVTPYKEGQTLDFFFQNSIHPLADVQTKTDRPVFVSIISQKQLRTYMDAGYNPTIIDTNAGDINQYYMISTGLGNRTQIDRSQLDDPQLKKNGMEFIYPLSSTDYIMKIKKGVLYVDVRTGPLKGISAKQLQHDLYPPVDKTTKAAFKNTTTGQTNQDEKFTLNPWDVLIGIILIGGIYYFLRPKSKKDSL